MQKNYFVIIAALSMIVTTPVISMETALAAKEKPKFIIALELTEVKQKEVEDSLNRLFDKDDAHACKVLGITWEEKNNRYFTDRAGIRKSGETKYLDCKFHYMPFSSTVAMEEEEEEEESKDNEYQYSIKFPKSLPATFVEKLERAQEQSITLENTLFADEVEIVVMLRNLKKLKEKNEESESSES